MKKDFFQKFKLFCGKTGPDILGDDKPGILPDDTFLVSYPRSGNTWLRFILANLIYVDENINFTNIHKYCPEADKLQDFTSPKKTARIIKSHAPFNPSFPKVVYIVRDGRDAYVSYYHYLKNDVSKEASFYHFLKEGSMPYGRWNDHVLSWLNHKNPLLIIRYEDLCCDPLSTVRTVMNFTNIAVADNDINKALEKSTFNKMQEIEKTYGRGEYKSGPEIFMRKGQIGDWKNYFGEEEKAVFKQNENNALIKLCYENSEGW